MSGQQRNLTRNRPGGVRPGKYGHAETLRQREQLAQPVPDGARDDGGMPTSDTYLHGHHDSVLRSHRWRTAENSAGYLLARLPAGARVLDVGCGPGTITVDLAARVPDGQVTGIDAAGDVLALARQEADRQGRANVRFEVGDVYDLGYADGTFDVVHAHQVLQHLSNPVAALTEMRRVSPARRPGRRARRRLRRVFLVPR